MDRRSLYDEDIYAWAQQQAATLRRLAETRHDLPNELDLENVAEEIEDVGAAQLGAAESFIRHILVHLIKLAAVPNGPPSKHWRKELISFHNELLAKLKPSMWHRIDLDLLWQRAIKEARASLEAEEVAKDVVIVFAKLQQCPVNPLALSQEDLDIDSALEALGVAYRSRS